MQFKRFISVICASSLLLMSAHAANVQTFTDIQGHWAYDTLAKAINDGYLHGNEGMIYPDGSMSGAEMAVLINQFLGLDTIAKQYPNINQNAWYASAANIAASAGYMPYYPNLDKNVSRAEAMTALCQAFGLIEVTPNFDVLTKFTDADQMTDMQKRAIAVLLENGLISGYAETTLLPNYDISRAEFIALLYRIMEYENLDFSNGDNISSDLSAPIQIISNASSLSDIESITADKIVLIGDTPNTSDVPSNTVSTENLVISTSGSDFSLSSDSKIKADTITIGGGTGNVNISSKIASNIMVTGSYRTVNLSGVNLSELTVVGSNNKIVLDSSCTVQNLNVIKGATNNIITMDGNAVNATVTGARTTLGGNGTAQNITVTGPASNVTLQSNTIDNSGVDNGLHGVTVNVELPTVQPGGLLVANATITGVDKPIICSAEWYIDGYPDASNRNDNFMLEDGKTSSLQKPIEFTRNMQLTHTIGFVLTYKNPVSGETEQIISGGDIQIINYPNSYYLPSAEEVLAKVSSVYTPGDWDYTPEEKIVFVAAKGYESDTEYLLWINRAAQMVNVFKGYKWNWELIHEFECATGKSSSPTPVGVTKVTYKQSAWVTSSYTCRPIVRFYPNTGYAFHSRLYYPGTNTLKDPSIGFPVSAGCVRMLDEGINWIYNNIPSGTTVVIF